MVKLAIRTTCDSDWGGSISFSKNDRFGNINILFFFENLCAFGEQVLYYFCEFVSSPVFYLFIFFFSKEYYYRYQEKYETTSRYFSVLLTFFFNFVIYILMWMVRRLRNIKYYIVSLIKFVYLLGISIRKDCYHQINAVYKILFFCF